MNEILRRLGGELRRKLASSLRRPLNWTMIDALVKIEEEDEAKRRDQANKKLPVGETTEPGKPKR